MKCDVFYNFDRAFLNWTTAFQLAVHPNYSESMSEKLYLLVDHNLNHW